MLDKLNRCDTGKVKPGAGIFKNQLGKSSGPAADIFRLLKAMNVVYSEGQEEGTVQVNFFKGLNLKKLMLSDYSDYLH